MRELRWIKEGAPLPTFYTLSRVLMQEERPEGTGTSSRRWLLCELEIPDHLAPADTPEEPQCGVDGHRCDNWPECSHVLATLEAADTPEDGAS